MAALIGISLKPKDDGSATASVPLDLLSEDGVPPEEGDSVSFSVDGTIQSIAGETADVSIDAINGNPVKEGDQEESDEDQNAPPGPNPKIGGPSSASMRPGLVKRAAQNRMPLF